METKNITCSLHGTQEMSLICTHLAHSLLDKTKVGFHEYDTGDMGRPDACCDACDERLDLALTHEEQQQWFLNCDYKILCAGCWDEAKDLNL